LAQVKAGNDEGIKIKLLKRELPGDHFVAS